MRPITLVLIAWLITAGVPAPAFALTDPPKTTDEDAKKPPSNTLRWTTASEVDNFGFDIYRSLTKDGPFEIVTPDPIAGAGTTDVPTKYVWVDKAIDPTKTYYYYVESISMHGVREHFTPVIKAPAKIKPKGKAEDASRP